jgi:hypothetical protein
MVDEYIGALTRRMYRVVGERAVICDRAAAGEYGDVPVSRLRLGVARGALGIF